MIQEVAFLLCIACVDTGDFLTYGALSLSMLGSTICFHLFFCILVFLPCFSVSQSAAVQSLVWPAGTDEVLCYAVVLTLL